MTLLQEPKHENENENHEHENYYNRWIGSLFLLVCLFGFDHAALVLLDKGLSLTKWSVQLSFLQFLDQWGKS